MDQKLRELERQAQDDHQAALKLAMCYKRLVQEQWSAVPCPKCPSSYRQECKICGGSRYVRINVSALQEYDPGAKEPSSNLNLSALEQLMGSYFNDLDHTAPSLSGISTSMLSEILSNIVDIGNNEINIDISETE